MRDHDQPSAARHPGTRPWVGTGAGSICFNFIERQSPSTAPARGGRRKREDVAMRARETFNLGSGHEGGTCHAEPPNPALPRDGGGLAGWTGAANPIGQFDFLE